LIITEIEVSRERERVGEGNKERERERYDLPAGVVTSPPRIRRIRRRPQSSRIWEDPPPCSEFSDLGRSAAMLRVGVRVEENLGGSVAALRVGVRGEEEATVPDGRSLLRRGRSDSGSA
jgi:hypothetical protein